MLLLLWKFEPIGDIDYASLAATLSDATVVASSLAEAQGVVTRTLSPIGLSADAQVNLPGSEQRSYPDSDAAAGQWVPSVGTSLYETVNEPFYPEDVDYISTEGTETAILTLQDLAAPSPGDVVIRVRAKTFA